MGGTAVGAGMLLNGVSQLFGANSQAQAQDANTAMQQQQLNMMRTAVSGYLGQPGATNPYAQAIAKFVGQQGNIGPQQQLLAALVGNGSPSGGSGQGSSGTGNGGGQTDGGGGQIIPQDQMMSGFNRGLNSQFNMTPSFVPGGIGGGGTGIGQGGQFGGGGSIGAGGGMGQQTPQGATPGGGLYNFQAPNPGQYMYNPLGVGQAPQVGTQQVGAPFAQSAQSGGFNTFQPGQVFPGQGVQSMFAGLPGYMQAPTVNNPGTLFAPQMSAAQSPWLQPFQPGQVNAGIVQAPQAQIPNMYTPPMLGQLPQVQAQQVGTGLGGWQAPGSSQQVYGTQYPSYQPPQAPPAFQNWFTNQLTSPNTTQGMNTGSNTTGQNTGSQSAGSTPSGRIPGAQYSADGTLTALPSGKGWGEASQYYKNPLAGFQDALSAEGDTAHFFLTSADWQAVQGANPTLYGKMQQANQSYFSNMSQSDVDALQGPGNDPLIYQTAIAARQAATARQTQQGGYTQANSPIASLVQSAPSNTSQSPASQSSASQSPAAYQHVAGGLTQAVLDDLYSRQGKLQTSDPSVISSYFSHTNQSQQGNNGLSDWEEVQKYNPGVLTALLRGNQQ